MNVSFNHASYIIGAIIGCILAVVLFNTVPAYHDFIVWSYTTPWLVIPSIALGVAVAIATD